jgi:outer membrane protein
MRNNRMLRLCLAALLSGCLTVDLPAQSLPAIAPLKPSGLPFIRSYEPVQVPPLRVSRTTHLQSLIRAGNLYLTAQEAIALVIENNADLELDRYRMTQAGWDVQRAQSGGPLRGVTTASNNTIMLGAGQGVAGLQHGGGASSTGGTASLTGAALIQQIGPITPQLDPIYTMASIFAHESSPQDQLILAGVSAYVDSARSYYASDSLGLLTGGSVRLSYTGSYLNEAVPTDVLNPTSYVQLTASFSHNLLNGFGERVNGRFIRQAKRRAIGSETQFRATLMTVVTNALNLYWNLSLAANSLKYKQSNRDVAEEFNNDVQKEIAAGAAASIDLIQARRAAVAEEQALTAAQYELIQAENAMKDAISWHGGQEPILEGVHIVTVDPLVVPEAEDLPPLNQLLRTAIEQRPDMALARMNSEVAEISASSLANGLLPTLRVYARTSDIGQTGQPVQGATPDPYFIGGASKALGQLFRRDFPSESAAERYTAPLTNRQAQADYEIEQLNHRQTQLDQQNAINRMAVQISNQVLSLERARGQYKASIESRGLLQKLLAGEERKLKFGASDIATVVAARRELATAQSGELAATATYIHNRIALDQALGVTLQANHISVEDAVEGRGTAPAQ